MMAVPGETPTLRASTDGPVFVTVVPANTENTAASPRSMVSTMAALAVPIVRNRDAPVVTAKSATPMLRPGLGHGVLGDEDAGVIDLRRCRPTRPTMTTRTMTRLGMNIRGSSQEQGAAVAVYATVMTTVARKYILATYF